MTSHLRFVQESYQPSINNGIGPAELLYTCSNYKNAPDKNAPIPEDHLTLWRNVRIVEDVSANLLNIADRQLNYEFDVSPQLLAANGGTICLAFMIGFRDDGFPDPLNLPPRWLPRGALGSFTIHGLDEIDQDDTRVGPLNPKNDPAANHSELVRAIRIDRPPGSTRGRPRDPGCWTASCSSFRGPRRMRF